MLFYFTTLFPILIFLTILTWLDSFALVKKGWLAMCVCIGIATCLAAVVISLSDTASEQVFPIIEELLKSLCLAWMIKDRRMVFLAEALCYGGAVGAGFALAENIIFLHYNPEMSIIDSSMRGVGTALMHTGCTAMFACLFLMLLSSRTNVKDTTLSQHTEPGDRRKNLIIIVSYFTTIAISVGIHYAFNMFMLPVFIQIVVTILFFLTVFVALSIYNERRVYSWMDKSITSDIQLLASIKEGKLAETPTGQYLLSMKQQFNPEVFFDIICFMQLYLELSVKGKSRMLLEQEGLAEPLTPEEQQEHNSQITELKTLKRNIGSMGEYILRPILRFAPEDMKVM